MIIEQQVIAADTTHPHTMHRPLQVSAEAIAAGVDEVKARLLIVGQVVDEQPLAVQLRTNQIELRDVQIGKAIALAPAGPLHFQCSFGMVHLGFDHLSIVVKQSVSVHSVRVTQQIPTDQSPVGQSVVPKI